MQHSRYKSNLFPNYVTYDTLFFCAKDSTEIIDFSHTKVFIRSPLVNSQLNS